MQEKHGLRETGIGCLSYTNQTQNLQPRHVPWPGIKPMWPFGLQKGTPVNWATLAWATKVLFKATKTLLLEEALILWLKFIFHNYNLIYLNIVFIIVYY